MAVGVGHQFVGLFAGRIETHRMVNTVVLGKGRLGVAAVHRTAGGIHQMLHVVMSAALEDVAKARQIALDIGRRVLDRIAHPAWAARFTTCWGLC